MRIILFVGPKGAGKTTLSRMACAAFGGVPVPVEQISARVLAARGGTIDESYARAAFEAIVEWTRRAGDTHELVFLDTTAASSHVDVLLAGLRRLGSLRLIRVRASEQTCRARIASRSSSEQIHVPDQLLRELHGRSEAFEADWDLELDNDAPLSAEEIRTALAPLVSTR